MVGKNFSKMDGTTHHDWMDTLRWMDLTEGQRGIYMEFHAPILENNIKRMPENEEILCWNTYTPVQVHIDAFTNMDGTVNRTGENLTREASYIHGVLSRSQKNAIIDWLSEEEESYNMEYTEGLDEGGSWSLEEGEVIEW